MKYIKTFEFYGANKEIDLLTDIMFTYYNSKKNRLNKWMDNSLTTITGDLPLNIKKIYIKKENSRDYNMALTSDKCKYDEKNGHILYFSLNNDITPTLSLFQHECTHGHQFIKSKGNIINYHHNELFPFTKLSSKNEEIHKFLQIMYYIQFHEVEAYYQFDLKYLEDKEDIKSGKIGEIIKYLNSFDVDEFFNNMNKENLNQLVSFYYRVKNWKPEEKKSILKSAKKFIKEFFGIDKKDKKEKIEHKASEQEIKNFIAKSKRLIEYNKKLYHKYLGKLKMTKMEVYEELIPLKSKEFPFISGFKYEVGDYVKLNEIEKPLNLTMRTNYSVDDDYVFAKIIDRGSWSDIKVPDYYIKSYGSKTDEIEKFWIKEEDIERRMTPDEIEIFEMKKDTKEFNL